MSAGGWEKMPHGEGSRLAVGGRVACHDCCDLQLLLLILDCITSIQSERGNIKPLGYTQLHVPLPHMIIGNARDDGGREARGSLRAFNTKHVHLCPFLFLLF